MDPFSDDLLTTLARQHGTPLLVYDAATTRPRVAALRQRRCFHLRQARRSIARYMPVF